MSASDPDPVRLGSLAEEIRKLESELTELRESRAFRLGDRMVGLVSPRAAPDLSSSGIDGLAPQVRLRELTRRRDGLARLVRMTREGIRLKVGRELERTLDNPQTGFGLPGRLTGLALAGLRKRVRHSFGDLGVGLDLDWLGSPAGPWPQGEPGLRVCVYAEVDPDRIDGATIWLSSVVEVLAGLDELRLTVLLAAPLGRGEVLGHLRTHQRVRFVQVRPPPRKGTCLSPNRAVRALEELERGSHQDLFVVRGPGAFTGWHVLDALAGRGRLAARTWAYLVDPLAWAPPLRRVRLWRVARRLRGMLCQTEEASGVLGGWLGAREGGRIGLLGPMIPKVVEDPKPGPQGRAPRLVYAGKFSPPYRILEMLDGFELIREVHPGAEFHVVGDKFHNRPRLPGFRERVLAGLQRPGVIWHGGLSRERTLEIVAAADVASSWRDDSFDDSLELATKVIESSGCGLPVVLNPTAMHRRLFGPDYPGYASSRDDFVATVLLLMRDPLAYETAAARALGVASSHTFDAARRSLSALLKEDQNR